MSQQADTTPVRIKAIDRYTVARKALDNMRVDLVALSEQAVHILHRRAEADYTAFLARLDQRARDYFEGTSRPVTTWRIPGTRFSLPDWKQKVRSGFFDPSLEHMLVEETSGGDRTITFDMFVKQCDQQDYAAVCDGLDKLAKSVGDAASNTSDGMDND